MKCFRRRGKKGEAHRDPADPPRRRANKRGPYANDRPPIVGTVGRESGQVRLRVVKDTTGDTLCAHVHRFTHEEAIVNTDDYQSYNALSHDHDIVCHSAGERARDGDGFYEIHTNTTEGLWAAVRTSLRVFRGVHKRYLSGYLAMCEFAINLKRISPAFISSLVRWQFAWA